VDIDISTPVDLVRLRAETPDIRVTDFEFKTPPLKHQAVTFEWGRRLPSCAILSEQGTGKSKSLLDILAWRVAHESEPLRPLILCPNSLVYSWEDQIKQHSDFEFVPITGTPRWRREGINAARKQKDKRLLFVANYEAAVAEGKNILSVPWGFVGCDESTAIKTHRRKRTDISVALGKNARFRYILTGTPMPQSPLDIWGQYLFLDKTIFGENHFAFKEHYSVLELRRFGPPGTRPVRVITGYRNIDELKKKVYSIGIRYEKSECLDLPPKVYEVRTCELDPGQQTRYRAMRQDSIIEEGDWRVKADNALARVTRLLQICSGFIRMEELHDPIIERDGRIYTSPTFGFQKRTSRYGVFKTNPKLNLLENLLTDILGNENKKVIIFSHYLKDLALIGDMLRRCKWHFRAIHGGIKNEDRQVVIENFRDTSGMRVLLAQTNCASHGLNLQFCSTIIYYSRSYENETRMQSEDRIHRKGQDESCTIYDIVVEKTMDQAVFHALREGIDLSKNLTSLDWNALAAGVIKPSSNAVQV
jgi:SNF2 family DNA or RNA helicase